MGVNDFKWLSPLPNRVEDRPGPAPSLAVNRKSNRINRKMRLGQFDPVLNQKWLLDLSPWIESRAGPAVMTDEAT